MPWKDIRKARMALWGRPVSNDEIARTILATENHNFALGKELRGYFEMDSGTFNCSRANNDCRESGLTR